VAVLVLHSALNIELLLSQMLLGTTFFTPFNDYYIRLYYNLSNYETERSLHKRLNKYGLELGGVRRPVLQCNARATLENTNSKLLWWALPLKKLMKKLYKRVHLPRVLTE
jgi:hypothetical protein